MQDVLSFILSVVLLLAMPGPTNTLLAASAASVGFRRSLRLLPAELGGYMIAITLYRTAAAPLVAGWPAAAPLLKLLAAAYLIGSSVGLVRRGVAAGHFTTAPMTRVFVTTLLNPKALILALAIFPQSGAARASMLFVLTCAAIGSGWLLIGHSIRAHGQALATPARVVWVTAIAQAGFAILISGSALAAMR